jgi:hypothetical protein
MHAQAALQEALTAIVGLGIRTEAYSASRTTFCKAA